MKRLVPTQASQSLVVLVGISEPYFLYLKSVLKLIFTPMEKLVSLSHTFQTLVKLILTPYGKLLSLQSNWSETNSYPWGKLLSVLTPNEVTPLHVKLMTAMDGYHRPTGTLGHCTVDIY